MRLCPHPVGRTTGFSHRVGASMANGLRPLYCPWSRCFVYHTIAWRGLHFALLCVARDLGWCDHEIIEALVGFCSPSYSGQGSSYVHWTTSLPSLYIRNIIPIRAPTGLSRVQSKPLPGRARISHPPARPDLFHPTSGKMNSRKFAVTSGRRFRFQGCRLLRTLSLSARIEDKFVGFVAKDCCEQWQLATLQVPENFSKERHIP